MERITLDGITFRLKQFRDFSWLKKYGTAFSVIDATGSGCLCIGMENGEKKYFLKIAGADTVYAEIVTEEAIKILKNAVHMYEELAHPNLVRLVESYAYENLYIGVFEWVDGECLFDFWNFEKYSEDPSLKSPGSRFKELPAEKKLQTAEVLFSFLEKTAEKGYVAVDLYDGSIMYDFVSDRTMICDIDFFRKKPACNDKGIDFWGTKRLKAPEEYQLGAVIDEATNVYTLGALIFDFFGLFSQEDIMKRYEKNSFFPCSRENWSLNEKCYQAALKATEVERSMRFSAIAQFHEAWLEALKG
ncbi:serine/threonine protein kinase [Lachnospiraceae bacterium NLAE-zl-G231]|nr:serine/threonine protein kinase [Lachnospiraceae bacterium NLAE-zl-G231]